MSEIATLTQTHTFNVLFIRNIRDNHCLQVLQNLIVIFKKIFIHAIAYAQNLQEKDSLKADRCFDKQFQMDYVIVVGGDGTMIYVSNLFNNKVTPPILGFAKGSTPILYNFSLGDISENYSKFLKNMKCKTVKSQECLRLHIKKRNLKNNHQEIFQNVAISEVVIHRGKHNSCVKVVIYIEDYNQLHFLETELSLLHLMDLQRIHQILMDPQYPIQQIVLQQSLFAHYHLVLDQFAYQQNLKLDQGFHQNQDVQELQVTMVQIQEFNSQRKKNYRYMNRITHQKLQIKQTKILNLLGQRNQKLFQNGEIRLQHDQN